MLKKIKILLLCMMFLETSTICASYSDTIQIHSENTPNLPPSDDHSKSIIEKNQTIFDYGFFLGIDLPTYRAIPKHSDPYFSPRKIGFGYSMGFLMNLQFHRCLSIRMVGEISFASKSISGRLIDAEGNIYEEKVQGILIGRDENGNYHAIEKYAPIKEVSIPSALISLPIQFKVTIPRIYRAKPYLVAGGGVSYDFMARRELAFLPFYPHNFDVFTDIGIGCEINLRSMKLSPELRYRIGFNNQMTSENYWNKKHWSPQWEDIEESIFHPTDNVGPYLLHVGECDRLFNQKLSIVICFEGK